MGHEGRTQIGLKEEDKRRRTKGDWLYHGRYASITYVEICLIAY